MLDTQVIKKFKQFQKLTGKYADLSIEDVLFEKISLSNNAYVEFVKGKNKYIQKYISKHPGKYPILGSSLKNDCIADYIEPMEDGDIVNQVCVSFNKDNAKGSHVFFRDYPFLMDRHHIAIIPSENIEPKYLYYSLIYYFEKNMFGWGENVASAEVVQKHFIPLPINWNEKYSSSYIQKAIVDFLDYSIYSIEKFKKNIDQHNDIVKRLKQSLIPSVFKRTAIQKRFKKYADEKGLDFDITDIEFDIKRIYSKNEDEIVCKKRMGFTPKTSSDGDINWFSVGDLNSYETLYIDIPNTSKKTTLKWIKQQVDKNNTGKSEKLISIKKGDILVSFKLTVGVVKIYNSDEPAYCNEAIDILSVGEQYYNEYVAYNCMLEYPNYGTKTNNGITLNDDDKAKIKIFVPKPLGKYSSLDIQKMLAQFITDIDIELKEKHFDKIERAYKACDRLYRTYLARTFALINWSQ